MGIQQVCSPLFKRKIFFFFDNRAKMAGFNTIIDSVRMKVSEGTGF
jgi:hypothetical protein